MGRGSREIPVRLGEKLTQIRSHLGVSQDGLVRQFGLSEKITRNEISKYERGVREPALSVLLKYARAAGVNVEVLIDDDLKLPSSFIYQRAKSKRMVNTLKGTNEKGGS
jgi:transcriptional regulator with XRE-family HTH domain